MQKNSNASFQYAAKKDKPKKSKEQEGGVTKRSKKKKKKKNKVKPARPALLDELEAQKREFDPRKIEFNRKVRFKQLEDQEIELANLKTLRDKILELYQSLFADNKQRLETLKRDHDALTSQYRKVKKKQIVLQTELDQENIKSADLRVRLTTFVASPTNTNLGEPEKRKPLDKSDHEYIKTHYLFYNRLFTDVTTQEVILQGLERRERKYRKRKATLKTERQLVNQEYEFIKGIDRTVRAQLTTFKRRNYYLQLSLDEVVERLLARSSSTEPELEASEILPSGGGGDEDVIALPSPSSSSSSSSTTSSEGMEEEINLSETEQSVRLKERIERIQQQLSKGEYTHLREEFSEEWQAFFLERLIRDYERKAEKAIAMEARFLIGYLLERTGPYMPFVYEVITQPTQDENQITRLSDYLREHPSIDIARPEAKIRHLLSEAPGLTRLELLQAIDRFLNDEGDEEVEEIVIEQPLLESSVEAMKAATLFLAYTIQNKAPVASLDKNTCLYEALEGETPVSILITLYRNEETEREASIYQLLSSGESREAFVQLLQLFRLELFPRLLFEPCGSQPASLLTSPQQVYITESLKFSLRDVMHLLQPYDAYCILFETIWALKQAKGVYGIQHNNLNLGNLRIRVSLTSSPPVRIYPNPSFQCQSLFRVVLSDFSYASLEPGMESDTRLLLMHNDYIAVRNLVLQPELQLVPETATQALALLLESGREMRGISFDVLLETLYKEGYYSESLK